MTTEPTSAANESLRLAYADPPYPGKADRYAENEEVDHVALIEKLRTYDGWALSTDERSLRYVLGLCPEGTRVLAWCRPNVAPFPPYPFAAWEPVLCWPARPRLDSVRSYSEITTVGGHMARENYRGQKPRGFCEWVLRCLGAVSGDTLDDLFPGSGVMTATFEWFSSQMTLAVPKATHAAGARAESNRLRRTHDPLPGFDKIASVPEGHDFYRFDEHEHKFRLYEPLGWVCRDCGADAPPELAAALSQSATPVPLPSRHVYEGGPGVTSTTYNHRKGSTFAAAQQRSAESRRCPKCNRKSALLFHSDDLMFGRYCRWDDCDYEKFTVRP